MPYCAKVAARPGPFYKMAWLQHYPKKTKTSRAGAKVVIVKGDEQGEVGVRQRSHAGFLELLQITTMPIFF